MTPSHLPETENYKCSFRAWLHGSTRGITAVALSLVWFFSTSSVARERSAYGPVGSVQADLELGRTLPGQQAADAKGRPAQSSGEAEVQAQTGQQNPAQTQKDQTPTSNAQPEEKKGEWLIAPIPINSPAIGAGLQWAVGRVFPTNKKDNDSPNSVAGIGGIITNNGSRGLALGGRLYLKGDRYRLAAGLGTAKINADIYGIGQGAGDRGIFVPLRFEGGASLVEFLFGPQKHLFIGARSQYRNLSLSLDQDKLDSSDFVAQPPDQVADVIDELSDQFLQQQTVSIGPRLEVDTRDNVYYPKHGIFMDFWLDFFTQGLGSKWSYQYYKFAFNKYNKVGGYGVFAFRGMACAAAGDRVPIYDLCLFGAQSDLRGYTAGRFQDRRMFATQAEYRLTLPLKGFLGRFGVVGFGGFGGVADKFSKISFDELLPAGGLGVRFRLTKKDPINYRIDYAFGRVGNTLTLSVGEAF